MKSIQRLLVSTGIYFFLCLSSCSTLNIPYSKGWSPGSGTQSGTMELGMVRVDKNTDWDSVEAETRRLLLLLLAEKGYKQTIQETVPEYRIDAVLIEREYMENWKTRRSLSAEIFIWKIEEPKIESFNELTFQALQALAIGYGTEFYSIGEKAPLAAGKTLLSGGKSLSSSKDLHNLLKLALDRALKALPKT